MNDENSTGYGIAYTYPYYAYACGQNDIKVVIVEEKVKAPSPILFYPHKPFKPSHKIKGKKIFIYSRNQI